MSRNVELESAIKYTISNFSPLCNSSDKFKVTPHKYKIHFSRQ